MTERTTTSHIIVHCSATPADMDIGAAEIDRWHRQRGWLKIGYHFVIRRDGSVETGRDLMQPGAHAKGWNHKSIGICMIGGVRREDGALIPEDNFTPDQWAALRLQITSMLEFFPQAHVMGHNEVSSKACPSFDVQAWFKATFLPADL